MPAGRPTKYDPDYCKWATKLCLLGATNEELATSFNVSVSTIDNWIADIPEFLGAIKEGREQADAKVSKSLYDTALEGNTTAQIFWLKNRRPRTWRDKQEIDVKSSDGSMSPTEEARMTARKQIEQDLE